MNGIPVRTGAKTLGEFIEEQEIATAGIAVAMGACVVRRCDWNSATLEEGAVITVIRATQGG